MLHKLQGSIASHRVLAEDFDRVAGANALAALSNFTTSAAHVAAVQGAGWSNGLFAPDIFVKASGTFVLWGQLVISPKDTGTLADNDGVTYQLTRDIGGGPVAVGPILTAAAQTSSGINGAYGGVTAILPFHMTDVTGAAKGTDVSYALKILSSNAHTSGVVATTDGWISVLELPPK